MTYCTGYPNRCNCISKPLQYPFATGVKCIGSQTAALGLMQQFSGLLQRYVTASYELICGSAQRVFALGTPSARSDFACSSSSSTPKIHVENFQHPKFIALLINLESLNKVGSLS